MRRMRKVGYALGAAGLAVVLLNVLAAVGEMVAYGTWWSDGRPAGLYRDDTAERLAAKGGGVGGGGGASVGGAGHFRVFLQPGAHLRGLLYEVSVNTLGFRGAEIAAEKPANGLRIWCVGGSTTFDIYAPDDASAWPAQVGARVQAALPGRSVEVVNAGIPGEVLAGNIEDLLAIGPRVRPDVVVVYGGPNDLRQVVGPGGAGPGVVGAGAPGGAAPAGSGAPGGVGAPGGAPPPAVAGPPPGVPWRERLDFALLRVFDRWAQGQGYQRTSFPAVTMRSDQIAALRRRLEAMIDAALQVGARPVLATHALRAAPDSTGELARRQVGETAALLQMEPVSAIAAFRDYNRLVVTLAAERGLPVADVRAAVPPDAALWGDATHFRKPGSDRAAEVVAGVIVGMGW